MATKEQIKAIGTFLYTYHSDLSYIRDYQNHKNDEQFEETFHKFLVEFRVIRNVEKGKSASLLKEVNKWKGNDVDAFANHIKADFTRNGTMTSLASKILFLKNPVHVFPLDTLAKESLSHKENKYAGYLDKIELFKEQNKDFAIQTFKQIEPYLSEIEREFKGITDIETIRLNRFIDKLLWVGIKLQSTT